MSSPHTEGGGVPNNFNEALHTEVSLADSHLAVTTENTYALHTLDFEETGTGADFSWTVVDGVSSNHAVLENFEGDDVATPNAFGSATASIVDDPATSGTRGKVVKGVSTSSGDTWQGFAVDLVGQNIDLTDDKTMSLEVYSDSSTEFAVKVQQGLDGAPESTKNASHDGNGWQTITVDFGSDTVDSKPAANGAYQQVAIHMNWDSSSESFGSAQNKTFYIDNIKGIGVDKPVEAAPTDAPTAPTEDSSTVLSLFSDAYTDVGATWNPNWNQSTVVEDVEIASNNVKKYSSFNYSGIEPSTVVEVNTYNSIKLDYWTADATALKVKFVDYGQDKSYDATTNVEKELTHTISEGAKSSWQTLQFNISAFEVPTGNIGQIVLSHGGEGTALVYFDNIYFSSTRLSNERRLLEEFSVYPNPVSNRISISAAESIDRMRIYDLTGKLVKQASPHKAAFSVDVSGLSKGVYLVKLNAGDREATTKMIK